VAHADAGIYECQVRKSFFKKATPLHIPRRDSISRPIAIIYSRQICSRQNRSRQNVCRYSTMLYWVRNCHAWHFPTVCTNMAVVLLHYRFWWMYWFKEWLAKLWTVQVSWL
jgi:hypothetical protein